MADTDGPPATLSLVVGESREFTLPGLGTAGYRWESALSGDTGAVSVRWRHGVADAGVPAGPIGASAPETVAFTAVAPGHATVTLAQRRPWETVAPRAGHVVEVDVRAP
ncbi:MAG: protease inhibitor I42 family protein [Actinobacteria bacterium]|nr:protease inhibitor I42 family protein [Actinomycetota bacterium]